MLLRQVLLVLLLALAFPSIAQFDEGQPFFSLSSSQTFAPGQRPAIQFWAHGLNALEFRVYRVNDPVTFFLRLEEAHSFGGHAARKPDELTPLERFHRWKARVRLRVRNVFRMQFDSEARAGVRDWLLQREQQPVSRAAAPVAEFAAVPLLNPQQVVAVWRQDVSRGRRWESRTIPVNVTEKGLYAVEATDGQLQAYTIVSITDLAVVTKGAPGRLLAWVLDRRTGAPVEGCEVTIRTGQPQPLRLRSGAGGLVETRFGANPNPPDDTVVMARRGADFAAVSVGRWNLGASSQHDYTGYVYTDRPVYRPGHTVHFRGILRAQEESGYRLPAERQVEVRVNDPENRPVFRRTLPLSATGTVHGDLTLAEAAPLGYYQVELRAGEHASSWGFQVEEYRKPEYEVKVVPQRRRVLQGEPVQAAVEARYYYGEPVAHAKIAYVVHRSRYWLPYYAEEEEEPGFEDEYGDRSGEQILEASGQLDAEGKLTIQIPTEHAAHDQRYRIEARVTDASNREISGSGAALATVGSYLVHVAPAQYVYSPQDKIRLNIETRDYDGKPVPQAPFRVELAEWRWQQPQGQVVATAEGQTDAAGTAQVELPGASGSLIARVRSRTPEGREVEDAAWVWVTGGQSWYGPRAERLQIVPDKKSYRPGEVARVLIVTGVPEAHLWVTTEGRGLYTSELVTASGPTVTVEVPIRPEYVPNFFLNAVFLRDHQLHQGSKSIKAPALEQQLAVEVRSSKSEYKPGESGTFAIEAKDHAGRPVSAEFSLGVVDEAIYAVRPETVPSLTSFFYGRTYNGVSTDSSLSYYFSGEAGKRRMQLARVRPAGARAQLKPERLVEPKVRRVFPDTIYWVADLSTGADGRAEAQVSFPDALTTWRATARGVTADTKVGAAVHKTIVRKNFIVRLGAPRFFTEGDEVTVPLVVHNYLATDKDARVSLSAEGVEILDNASRDIKVASKGQVQIDCRLRAGAPGKAVLLAKALSDEESDALELTLPVLPYGVKLSQAKGGSLAEPRAETEVELSFPPEAAPGSRTLEIEVAPSLAGAIFGALEYLTSYPYGCTEQTMSSFLPNVVVAQAVKALGLKPAIDAAQLERKIRAGLDRLYDYHHQDGGWGWWEADDSDAFMTAYVLAGLQQARAAGYRVQDHRLQAAAAWLRNRLPQMGREPADRRAYVLYALALAGEKESARRDQLWEERSSLTSYGLALLGLAMEQAGDERAAQAAALLESAARVSEREAWWQVERDGLMDIYMDASPEATAHALKLLAKLRPQSPLLEKAALYLVNHRDQGHYWSSTKQTAMVIYGLTDYLRRSAELRPDFSATVTVNGRQVFSRRFTQADALAPAPASIRIPAAGLAAGKNTIRLGKSGDGRLYWSARLGYYSPAGPLARTGSDALSLHREYFKLTPTPEGSRIVYALEPLTGPVQRGDVLAVRLTLSGGRWRYLMLEDPIPSGAEFIARDDLYELKEKPPWWSSWYTRREFHDDRAAIFQTFFNGGQGQYFYLLKVTNPGQFRVSPARVEPMYQPQQLATTEGRTLEVR